MKFLAGFNKVADDFTTNAKAFQTGFNAGGPTMAQTLKNFKNAFSSSGGMKAPPAAPSNVSVGGG